MVTFIMAENVVVSLPQLVDLALTSPDVGSVNFHILHSLLHVIIQQTTLSDINVEFQGKDSERVKALLSAGFSEPTVLLTEYVVQSTTQSKTNISVDGSTELSVIDPRKDSKEEPTYPPPELQSVSGKSIPSSKKKAKLTKKIKNQSSQSLGQKVVVMQSNEIITTLKQDVSLMKQQLNQIFDTADNDELIEAIRNDEKAPVAQMWQTLNLGKRMDATEEGINKLSGMIETLTREIDSVWKSDEDKDKEHREEIKAPVKPIKVDRPQVSPKGSRVSLTSVTNRMVLLEKKLQEIEQNINNTSSDAIPSKLPPAIKDELQNMHKEIENLHSMLQKHKKQNETATTLESSDATKVSDNTPDINDQLTGLDTSFHNEINGIKNTMHQLQQDLSNIHERINSLATGDEEIESNLNEMYSKINEMQYNVTTINATATKLIEDKDEREVHLNAIIEQIELLKTIKADKEDLEDALANKADQLQMNRKVSHDQFDAVYDDLSRGVEDALTKLTRQEELWHATLDEIQKTVGNKLDKLEFTPLRDFINSKLKILQNKLKDLSNLKKETEAAGTKSKILRNINCISCDKDVVMRKELDHPPVPSAAPLPPNRSMRPYLTYELDAVRKQQKKLPQGRNMNQFETLVKEETRARSKSRERPETAPQHQQGDHLCNRYCGGSHTTTTPQQRVTRLGHFLMQWGPEAVPLLDGFAQGTDGQYYKTAEPSPRNNKPVDVQQ